MTEANRIYIYYYIRYNVVGMITYEWVCHQSINSIIYIINDWYSMLFKNKMKSRELFYSVYFVFNLYYYYSLTIE